MRRSLLITALLVGATSARAADSAKQIDAIYPSIDKLYIDLHRNPELAFHEKRTAATLAARVKALGYDVTTGVGSTGVVAILKNGAGPVVMFRTELDALPIEENTGLPFASTVKTKTDAGETSPRNPLSAAARPAAFIIASVGASGTWMRMVIFFGFITSRGHAPPARAL
jgi:hippurate hydrolase